MSSTVRVITYNVLSSAMSTPEHYPKCDPEILDPEFRLRAICEHLKYEIRSLSIICLQEVSITWAAKLTTFFHERKYHFIVTNYGTRFNGYMGVAIAYPMKAFILMDVQIINVADTKKGGWGPPKPTVPPPTTLVPVPKKSTTEIFKLGFGLLWLGFASMFGVKRAFTIEMPEKRVETPWTMARYNFNRAIILRLRTFDDIEFLICTHHLPCMFHAPSVMSIHTAMYFQAIHELSKGEVPVIVAGDFNFKPNSPQYAMVTRGDYPHGKIVDPADPETDGKEAAPPEPAYRDDPFRLEVPCVMRSAYKELCGREPEWTVKSFTERDKKLFQDTVDYVFFQTGKQASISVVSVLHHGHETDKELGGNSLSLPGPCLHSDHVMIGANFSLVAL